MWDPFLMPVQTGDTYADRAIAGTLAGRIASSPNFGGAAPAGIALPILRTDLTTNLSAGVIPSVAHDVIAFLAMQVTLTGTSSTADYLLYVTSAGGSTGTDALVARRKFFANQYPAGYIENFTMTAMVPKGAKLTLAITNFASTTAFTNDVVIQYIN